MVPLDEEGGFLSGAWVNKIKIESDGLGEEVRLHTCTLNDHSREDIWEVTQVARDSHHNP